MLDSYQRVVEHGAFVRVATWPASSQYTAEFSQQNILPGRDPSEDDAENSGFPPAAGAVRRDDSTVG